MDWKLSLVTGCRARQKIMKPKYTLKVDIQEGSSLASAEENLKELFDYIKRELITWRIRRAL